MFLPLSFFLVKIILSIFQILMVGAVTAGLALYARFGGEYANSIRWIRQGGYLEMGGALYNSGRTVPIQAKTAMVVTLIVSIAATQLDTAISVFIKTVDHPDREHHVVFTSKQLLPQDVGNAFKNWSTSIGPNDDIIHVMKEMINNTVIFDGMSKEQSYTTRLTDYTIKCENPGITLMGNQSDNAELTNGDCYKLLVSNTPGRPNYQNNSIQQSSPWSIASPALPDDHSTSSTRRLEPLRVNLVRGGDHCQVGEIDGLNEDTTIETGVVSVPTTITVKCIDSDMHISVLSVSTVRFVTPSANLWKTAASILGDDNGLFQALESSMKQVNPVMNASIFTEVRAFNASIEIATCVNREAMSMLCLYTNINGFVLDPQEVNRDLVNVHEIGSFKSNHTKYAAISISHIPSNDGKWEFATISRLKDDTRRVSQLMAALGQNFFTDESSLDLYVLYDTNRKVVEVPDWLVYSSMIFMAICLCFWVSIMILLRDTHTGSLYKNISSQLASRAQITGPSIMRSTTNPVTIEGIPLAYDQDGLD
ncbi:hypothetical protein BGZ65_003864 [Modicella reniformis]|uniref:Uncharacterized protein n=1 Tax=Modicella reniformis TaxID=1440133 RepID=A0A9P6M951_9FUNG|nr:hypothetical protein BGZ65_003864 [Modicella reniformis]